MKIQKKWSYSIHKHFSIVSLWDLSVAMSLLSALWRSNKKWRSYTVHKVNNGHFDIQGDMLFLADLTYFELVQDFMHVIVICKFHSDPTKNEEATLITMSIIKKLCCSQAFCHCKPMGPISCNSNQSSEAVFLKCICRQPPTKDTYRLKFGWDLLVGCKDIAVRKCRTTTSCHPISSPPLAQVS